MRRAPVTFILVLSQILMAVLLAVLCVVWIFRTRDMGSLAVQTSIRSQETAQNRQAFMALLQETAVYSERNPSMRSLLQQLGVKINGANPTNLPSARR